MIRGIAGRIQSRLPILLGKHHNFKTKYKGFSKKTDKQFHDFVEAQQNHSAKQKTLSLLEQDPILSNSFSLLDIGCGPGVLPQMILRHSTLKKRISYTGVDQSSRAIEYCSSKYSNTYKFISRDVLKSGLPEEDYNVITINEVLEHVNGYEKLISMAIEKNPLILVVNTFAVLPELHKHRLLWRRDTQCFMNSYSFKKFFCYLRDKTEFPIQIFDFGTRHFNRHWFPRKAEIVWYMKISESQAEQGTPSDPK